MDGNLDLLLDVLDRSVERPAVRRVLTVLRAAATQQSAQRVLQRVREKLANASEPREALAALAGDLLQRFPDAAHA